MELTHKSVIIAMICTIKLIFSHSFCTFRRQLLKKPEWETLIDRISIFNSRKLRFRNVSEDVEIVFHEMCHFRCCHRINILRVIYPPARTKNKFQYYKFETKLDVDCMNRFRLSHRRYQTDSNNYFNR